MKLLDFIPYLLSPEKLTEYYRQIGIPAQSACPLIYLHDALSASSEMAVLEMEETDGNIRFTKNGVDYVTLMGVDHAVEFIEDEFSPKVNAASHQEIVDRLIEYATYDA